jgi:cobalt-zinc-cadmium efflux system membrane fusion protein
MQQSDQLISRRAWPPGQQLRVVLVMVVVAALILVGWGALRAHAGEQPPGNESTANNEVHLSSAQLATLEINSVANRTFRTEEVTDGQIALNGDTTTQVFSPYSGRVTRVMASPGEYVKQGAPLLRLEAWRLRNTCRGRVMC